MFVKPSAFEYLLFDIDNWDKLSRIEKIRVSLYFIKDPEYPNPKDWQAVANLVQEFEKFMGITKVVQIKG